MSHNIYTVGAKGYGGRLQSFAQEKARNIRTFLALSNWKDAGPGVALGVSNVPMNLSDDFILELTQCQQRLYGYIYRRMANRDQAMEVLQQTNLVLCRKADDFELGTNFNAWAATVAHYQILSYRKTLARDRLVFTEDVIAAIDEREDENEMREGMLRHLRHCYAKMSDDNQELMKLRYERELSMEQLAREIGKKVVAVRVKLHRLRRSLRDCVQTRLQEEKV